MSAFHKIQHGFRQRCQALAQARVHLRHIKNFMMMRMVNQVFIKFIDLKPQTWLDVFLPIPEKTNSALTVGLS